MKMKRFISALMAAVIFMTSLVCGGVSAAARDASLKVAGGYENDYYVIDLYGLTRKQYSTLINGADVFYAGISTADEDTLLCTRSQGDYGADTVGIITGYTGTKSVFACEYSESLGIKKFSMDGWILFEGLYGNAADGSYGFRWKLNTRDADTNKIVTKLRSQKSLTASLMAGDADFENCITIDGINTDTTVVPDWSDGMTAQKKAEIQRSFNLGEYRIDSTYGFVIFVPEYECDSLISQSESNSETTLTVYAAAENHEPWLYCWITYDRSKDMYYYETAVYSSYSETYDYDMYVNDEGGLTILFMFNKDSFLASKLAASKEFTYCCTTGAETESKYSRSVTDVADLILSHGTDTDSSRTDINSLSIGKVPDKAYTGKALRPYVTLKDGKKTLEQGKDFTVSYQNNVKVGAATLIITGIGDYSGTKTLTFNILPKKVKLSVKQNSNTKVTLSWKKSTGAKGYQIYQSVGGGKFKLVATVKNGSTVKKVLTGLKLSSREYEFKVRPYATANGKTIYGSWSNIVTV